MTTPDIDMLMPVAIAWETGDGWVWKRLGTTSLNHTLTPGYAYQVMVSNDTMVPAGVAILSGGKETPGVTCKPGESGMIRAIPVEPGAVVQIKPVMTRAATPGGKLTATIFAYPLA